jgi:predicted O-methyltransferase YrrM
MTVAACEAREDHCLALLETLVRYRQEPIHAQLSSRRSIPSMLHLDVLILIYHFAKTAPGHVLEIGAYLGGGTVAAALGVRDSGQQKQIFAIEPGGRFEHHRVGSRNILRDLYRNLARARVADLVTVFNGRSFDQPIVSAVKSVLASEQIGVLILDADGAVERDLKLYRDHLAERCWLVIDDYFGPPGNDKAAITRSQVDALVESGQLVTLGVYGWGTWVGCWQGSLARARPSG